MVDVRDVRDASAISTSSGISSSIDSSILYVVRARAMLLLQTSCRLNMVLSCCVTVLNFPIALTKIGAEEEEDD